MLKAKIYSKNHEHVFAVMHSFSHQELNDDIIDAFIKAISSQVEER